MSGYFIREYAIWRGIETGQNQYGESIITWAKLADVPGRAYPERSREVFAGNAIEQGIVTWTFATDPTTDIKEADQVRFDDRILEVQVVAVTSSGQRIEALCKELR